MIFSIASRSRVAFWSTLGAEDRTFLADDGGPCGGNIGEFNRGAWCNEGLEDAPWYDGRPEFEDPLVTEFGECPGLVAFVTARLELVPLTLPLLPLLLLFEETPSVAWCVNVRV